MKVVSSGRDDEAWRGWGGVPPILGSGQGAGQAGAAATGKLGGGGRGAGRLDDLARAGAETLFGCVVCHA